jgi:hypothetical protein
MKETSGGAVSIGCTVALAVALFHFPDAAFQLREADVRVPRRGPFLPDGVIWRRRRRGRLSTASGGHRG